MSQPGGGSSSRPLDGRTLEVEISNPCVAPAGHVEYEVVLDLLESDVAGTFKSRRVRWVLMKRFREFAALDWALRAQYGGALAGVELPPKRWFGNLEPDFICERQAALQASAPRCRPRPRASPSSSSRAARA